MDKRKLNLSIFFLAFILLILVIYGMIWIVQNETRECLKNPIIYGLYKVEVGNDFNCLCFGSNGDFKIDKVKGLYRSDGEPNYDLPKL